MSDKFKGVILGLLAGAVLFIGGSGLSGIVIDKMKDYDEIDYYEYRSIVDTIKDDDKSKTLFNISYVDNKITNREYRAIMSRYYHRQLNLRVPIDVKIVFP